ncbi:hypothetical protein [Curtobacterium pusillum]|uniref:hypothetical protein n=1 Tax=Curtobacterium pusillum TaxID=69373 RepID=UPI0011A0E403|nr:hypothetical protein [Curtobacterium pusillum]
MAGNALLIPLATAADLIRDALRAGRTAAADRALTDAVSRILHAAPGTTVSEDVTRPAPSVGDEHYDALLTTSFAWALLRMGVEPPQWMLDAQPLEREWLWDGDDEASPEWRSFIKERTPEMFLGKNILLRERDLEAA